MWVIYGLSSTLIYTSELILCSTICVPSATRHNIHKFKGLLLNNNVTELQNIFLELRKECNKC